MSKRWEMELDDAALLTLARQGAATGRHPGDVLAEALVEQTAEAERRA